jgi:hypothetical protein
MTRTTATVELTQAAVDALGAAPAPTPITPPALDPVATAEAHTAARFHRDTADHQLTVLHDDDLYRHIRLKNPKSSAYWYDLITWPGHLAVVGDCGSFTFARVPDMFDFHRGRQPNPHYWAQKELSGAPKREYSEDAFRQIVTERTAEAIRWSDAPRGIGKAVRAKILQSDELYHEASARELLEAFEYKGFTFEDTWEWSFSDWDWQYLWCCHAIVAGISAYDALKVEQNIPAPLAAAPSA